MKSKIPDQRQLNLFYSPLQKQLNPKHPLYILSQQMPWDMFEETFSPLYSHTGRPAKSIRLMIALLILKQMYDLSDESVVERWVENPYYQFFSGETYFQWEFPVHPTDLVLFRQRIGEKGIEKIFQVSIDLHGEKAKETEVLIDTTVQEKNIAFPTDTKLYKKVIDHCVRIAENENIDLRQTYKRTAKKLMLAQRFRHHPKNRKKADAAQRKLKTIAGRLIRELHRKLSSFAKEVHQQRLELFEKVLAQTRNSAHKIYSLHEPEVYCISKGKDHKKYEFGAKASIVVTKNKGIIIGAKHIAQNKYDGNTLSETLNQTKRLTGKLPGVAICDRGFRGKFEVDGVEIVTPRPPGKKATPYEKQKARKRFRRRAGIEPIIGHLKSDYRLYRNYLKGTLGDSINLMLAAAAFNFRKLMKAWADFLYFLFLCFQRTITVEI